LCLIFFFFIFFLVGIEIESQWLGQNYCWRLLKMAQHTASCHHTKMHLTNGKNTSCAGSGSKAKKKRPSVPSTSGRNAEQSFIKHLRF